MRGRPLKALFSPGHQVPIGKWLLRCWLPPSPLLAIVEGLHAAGANRPPRTSHRHELRTPWDRSEGLHQRCRGVALWAWQSRSRSRGPEDVGERQALQHRSLCWRGAAHQMSDPGRRAGGQFMSCRVGWWQGEYDRAEAARRRPSRRSERRLLACAESD